MKDDKPKWWVKTLIGILLTGFAAVASVLWTDRMVMETRLRGVEIRVSRQDTFQSEVLRRLERIERKLDAVGGASR